MTEPAILFEACVESVAEAVAAERGGAGRVELCVDLAVDGLTPPAEMIAGACRALTIPVMVLVRPRAGGFHYSADEIDGMIGEVERIKAFGAAGVVVGALDADGAVDRDAMTRLVSAARPMSVTFHRAFDVVADRSSALDALIGLGVERVLTSGGATTAELGIGVLQDLVRQAAGRIGILAGGGIRPQNVARIVEAAGVHEVHAHTPAPALVAALPRRPRGS
ncbi:MAG TPA: copper homeostasis protein CutC [Gemmatimonadales bacterium]|nr:copper homeostasis protein CutC [Gemmatimonadales bacterium]